MNLFESIQSELGGGALQQIGQALGTDENQTQKAIAAALPMLLGGLAKNASSPSGASALAGALEQNHAEPFTDILGALSGASGSGGLGALAGMLSGGGGSSGMGGMLGAAASMLGGGSGQSKAIDGLGILGHIFGAKQNQVEQGVAKASGLDLATIVKFLPMLAPIVMSALGTVKKKQNLGADQLAGFLQGQHQEIAGSGASGLTQFLDSDGDGEIGDNLMQIGGALLQSGVLGKLLN